MKTTIDMERTSYALFFGERSFSKFSAVFEIKIECPNFLEKIAKIPNVFLDQECTNYALFFDILVMFVATVVLKTR